MGRVGDEFWQEMEGPRTLRTSEVEASHRLAVLCFGEGVPEDEPVAGFRPSWQESVEVFVHRGEPVAQIGIYHSRVSVYGSQLRIASIGGVGTHPDYRKMGLGTRLLDHCMHKLAADGARLMLISGTRGLYQRAGCIPAQRFERVTLKHLQRRPGDVSVSIRPASGADAGLCARLYQMEPVHFVRRVEDFARCLRREGSQGGNGNWIAELEGEPVAFLFAAVPWGRKPEDGVREVVILGEYAGSRLAVLGALAEVLARPDIQELWLAVPWWDVDLLQLLKSQGVVGQPTSLAGHTMRIVNWPGLMTDLTDYIAQRLPGGESDGLRCEQDGDCYSLSWGDECVALDGAGMTRLVLGMPETGREGISVPEGTLREITGALFPLPSFRPGLNSR